MRRFEVCCHDIVHQVVEVGPIDEALSLVAGVHGRPAELIISRLSLHEAPHGATHHRHWLLVRHDQDLSRLVNINSFAKELTCVVERNEQLISTYMLVHVLVSTRA